MMPSKIRSGSCTIFLSQNGTILPAMPQLRMTRCLVGAYALKETENDVSFTDSIGMCGERNHIRERITRRLQARLKEGMIDEVKALLEEGIPPERLIRYGLEYKFVTQYLTEDLHYGDMVSLLNTAIHQFSKRQMTWFRRMERMGFRIHWVDADLPAEEKFSKIYQCLREEGIDI